MRFNSARIGQRLRSLLAVVGALALIGIAGAMGLHAMRNRAPDGLREIVSPNGRYRIAIEEDLVGFPGQVCVNDVHVLKAGASLDRTDEDTLVYAGTCQGLGDIRWVGAHIEATLNLPAALDGVSRVTLRPHGANGKVDVKWVSNLH